MQRTGAITAALGQAHDAMIVAVFAVDGLHQAQDRKAVRVLREMVAAAGTGNRLQKSLLRQRLEELFLVTYLKISNVYFYE